MQTNKMNINIWQKILASLFYLRVTSFQFVTQLKEFYGCRKDRLNREFVIEALEHVLCFINF